MSGGIRKSRPLSLIRAFPAAPKARDSLLAAVGCLLPRFDHADLLDDIVDHWDANAHLGERRFFVESLQAVAKAREARVSFISGDVHCAGIGRLYSHPKVQLENHL